MLFLTPFPKAGWNHCRPIIHPTTHQMLFDPSFFRSTGAKREEQRLEGRKEPASILPSLAPVEGAEANDFEES